MTNDLTRIEKIIKKTKGCDAKTIQQSFPKYTKETINRRLRNLVWLGEITRQKVGVKHFYFTKEMEKCC